jgi:hypothetical protein
MASTMSAAHLAELGQQILRATEGDQLKTSIALTSLEDVHRLLVLQHAEDPHRRDSIPWQNQSAVDAVNAQRIYGDQNQFSWDEHRAPAVIGPQYDQEMMVQASSIPFLYHRH